MNKKILLALLIISAIDPNLKGQQPESNIYNDSLGQIYVKANSPVYFFIATDSIAESRFPIPNNGAKPADPMYFKGNGTHFIKAEDEVTNNPVGFKVVSDGIAPTVSIRFTNGLLMSSGKKFYVDEGATAEFVGKDNLSGVRSIAVSLNGGDLTNSRTVIFDKGNDCVVRTIATDNVGNTSDTIKFRVITAVNSIIKIDNIYFDTNSSRLRPESRNELNEFVQVLMEYPEVRIELRAHTDSRGDATYNLNLSEMRAEAVVNYLVLQGIDNNRLTFKGYGDSSPVNECARGVICSEEKLQENRRVEFKILPIK